MLNNNKVKQRKNIEHDTFWFHMIETIKDQNTCLQKCKTLFRIPKF